MSWNWLVLGVLSFLLVGFMLLLIRSRLREVDQFQFEHCIRGLLLMKKDGGSLTVSHRGSPAIVRFWRAAGRDRHCDLLLDVPRTSWAEERLSAIRDLLDRRDLLYFEPPENKGVLLRVRLRVTDIWDPAAGADGARIAQEIFKILGAEDKAKYAITTKGENSIRVWGSTAKGWVEKESPVLRNIGESTLKDLQEEERESQARESTDHKKASKIS